MRKKLREMPLYQKSEEIYRTVKTICDLIPEENEYLQHTKMHLMENTMVIQAKISGAEAVNLWDIKMENAAIIRKCARELVVLYHSLTSFGFDPSEIDLDDFNLDGFDFKDDDDESEDEGGD